MKRFKRVLMLSEPLAKPDRIPLNTLVLKKRGPSLTAFWRENAKILSKDLSQELTQELYHVSPFPKKAKNAHLRWETNQNIVEKLSLLCGCVSMRQSRFMFMLLLITYLESLDLAVFANTFIIMTRPWFQPSLTAHYAFYGSSIFAITLMIHLMGAVLFFYCRDKAKIRMAMRTTIILMCFATLGIAFLPGYQEIGVFSVISLIFLRMTQCALGMSEHTKKWILTVIKHHERAYSKWVYGAIGVSILFGILTGSYWTGLSTIIDNRWRTSLIICGLLSGTVSILLRERTDHQAIPKRAVHNPLKLHKQIDLFSTVFCIVFSTFVYVSFNYFYSFK